MRVSLFLDGANFFYMQRDSLHWWIDLRKLLEFARSQGELVDAFYYIGVDVPPDARQQAYLDTVTRLGFALVTKQLKTIMQADGTSTQKANLDIEGGVSNVDMDGNNALYIKAIQVFISTFETLPGCHPTLRSMSSPSAK